jgi:cell division septum initiation protein DivIVA
MDILTVLDDLKKLAMEQPKTLLIPGLTWGLHQDEIDMTIVKIRSMLPDEVKAAAVTVRESDRIIEAAKEDARKTADQARAEADRILAEAQQEAERILEQTRIQQERMISDSEVLKLAKAQSEEIRNAADRDAVQMRRGAEKYAVDVLSQLEGVVGKVMTTIERGKGDLRSPDPIQNGTIVNPLRDREKVRA